MQRGDAVSQSKIRGPANLAEHGWLRPVPASPPRAAHRPACRRACPAHDAGVHLRPRQIRHTMLIPPESPIETNLPSVRECIGYLVILLPLSVRSQTSFSFLAAQMRLQAALLPLLLAPSLALRAAPVPTTRLRPHHVQQHAPALVMRRSTAPPHMVALPMCPAGGVLSLAVKAGCATVLAQCGLVAAFRSSSDPVLKQAPGYAAHQLVALAMMLFAYALRTRTPD